ncbi:hypothetical protein A2851_04890 [Candidatus Kaiserbacteria bacterium RIFCSPHIGHO2_01_FULL_53_29]|nr:MAG: hypothetical protein A2851_04890 [Candidatus Kaiserbacteria bacterium RIFCSPHIGHO2_01_FULL_53_29]
MLLIFRIALSDKYAFDGQVREQPNPPRTYLTFLGNATNWLAFFVANPLAAVLIEWHASSWRAADLGIISGIVFVVGLLMIIPLLQDSKTTPSAYFRNGWLTQAGAIYQLVVWPYQVSVFVAFYVLTPAAQVTTAEGVIVTALLLMTWGVSTLQPPKKVHGETNGMAWAGAIAGWIVIVVGVVYQLKFA